MTRCAPAFFLQALAGATSPVRYMWHKTSWLLSFMVGWAVFALVCFWVVPIMVKNIPYWYTLPTYTIRERDVRVHRDYYH